MARTDLRSGVPEFDLSTLKSFEPDVVPAPERHHFPTFAVLFGIALPLAAVLWELATRMCTSSFFDPLPNIWYVLLYLTIPASTLFVLAVEHGHHLQVRRWAALLNGLAIAAAAVFTLKFLPLLPIGVALTFAMGIGLPALSPVLGLIATIRNHAYLNAMDGPPVRSLWWGLALGLCCMAALEVPVHLTNAAMHMAVSDTPEQQVRGLHLLRTVGSKAVMLQACYAPPASFFGRDTDGISTEQARTLFYRVTGTPFNAHPRPNQADSTWMARRSTFDEDRGGTAVGGYVDGLSLQSSRIDGTLDPDAALGYLEWKLVFNNTSDMQQEARVQVALPAGAVVSRAVLWVNGEPREAAYAARGRVRQAYQQVAVVQQRDPLLVTTCGPDRVLVQCFPVPARGKMEILLGMSTPMRLADGATALLPLPRMVERNFRLDGKLRHALWLESKGQLTAGAPGLQPEHLGTRGWAVRGEVTEGGLAQPITVKRNSAVTASWTADPLHRGLAIQQRLVPAPKQAPARIVVVLDGAGEVARHAATVAHLGALQQGRGTVLLAGDTVETLLPEMPLGEAFGKKLLRQLQEKKGDFTGGPDNIPALGRAWDLAAAQPNSIILWVHGPQPMAGSTEGLRQRFERRPDGPQLYDLQVTAGPNTIIDALEGVAAVHAVPLVGSPRESLQRQVVLWGTAGPRTLVAERVRVPVQEATGTPTSRHLARLWARDGAMRRYYRHTPADTEMAIAMASQYLLVTPVTGAVVLESKGQYKANNLEPAQAGAANVPAVPEPEEWLLIGGVALLLLVLWWRRRTTPMVPAV